MTIEQALIDKYGPLLSLTQLAVVLKRAPNGLGASLRNNSEWSAKINTARIKRGRRVYFRTEAIAQLLAD